jgi:histidine triad (HIT) family protein
METVDSCIFCQIAIHTHPAQIYYEEEEIVAFQDTKPVAPVHILIIPKKHIDSINLLTENDAELIGKMVLIGQKMAKEFKVDQSGYRLVFNTGPHAGQSVFHVHLHLIGGRHLPFRFE